MMVTGYKVSFLADKQVLEICYIDLQIHWRSPVYLLDYILECIFESSKMVDLRLCSYHKLMIIITITTTKEM